MALSDQKTASMNTPDGAYHSAKATRAMKRRHRGERGGRGWLVTVVAILTLIFLIAPVLIIVPMSFSSASTLAFPPPSFSLRWYEALFNDRMWLEALRTSVLIALLVSVLSTLIGGIGAYALVRHGGPWSRVLILNSLAPLVMPQIVTAIALYLGYAKAGLINNAQGLVLSHLVLAIPFVVLVTTAAVRGLDVRLEQAASTLGASRWKTIQVVVLPLLAPSLAAAGLFAFIASFDEAVVTLFIAGPIETVPKKMFTELVRKVDPTITAISTILIAFSIILLVVSSALTRIGKKPTRRP